MRLKARIDGRCEMCAQDLIDRAFSVVVMSHTVILQGGDPGIKEEHEVEKTLCPQCYASVYRNLSER